MTRNKLLFLNLKNMKFNALYKNKIGILQIDWIKHLTWEIILLTIYFVELCVLTFLWMIIYSTMTTILYIYQCSHLNIYILNIIKLVYIMYFTIHFSLILLSKKCLTNSISTLYMIKNIHCHTIITYNK